jgi:hypothetical protein
VTEFRLFGVQAALGPEPDDALSAPAMPSLEGVRILLVEDNPVNQNVARGILEQAARGGGGGQRPAGAGAACAPATMTWC